MTYKRLTSLTLVPILLISTIFTLACTQQDLVNNAQFVLQGFQQLLPAVKAAIPKLSDKVGFGLTEAQKLVDAIAANAKPTAIDLLNALVPIIQDIIAATVVLDPAQAALVNVGLGFAKIGLVYLLKKLQGAAPTALTAASAQFLVDMQAEGIA